MGQTKSAGSSSQVMVKTQLLQAYFFMVNTPLDLTVSAKSGEGQLAAFNTAAGALISQLCGNRNLMHVHHRVTVAADEVDMGVRVGIEPFDAVDGCDAGDLTLFFEKGQIAVDRCL